MSKTTTKKPVIILLGRPGSGKDTQGGILARRRGLEIINSGAILRALKGNKKKFRPGSAEKYEADMIEKIMNEGKLVPTLTVVSQWRTLFLKIMRNHQRVRGVIFFGSPRKLAEAWLIHEFFKNWPDAAKYFKLYPFEIKISDKEAIKRLSMRRQCAWCGKIFSGSPEDLKLEVCDRCGGKLMKRKDDAKTSIKARLREFYNYTAPVLKYFKNEGILKSVNGERPVEAISRDIANTLRFK